MPHSLFSPAENLFQPGHLAAIWWSDKLNGQAAIQGKEILVPAKKTANKTKLRAGYAKRDITPSLPFPLAGYAARSERLADTVRDPLTARAVVFAAGGKQVALVSVDLLLISVPLREDVARRVREAGVRLDGLLLTATHTHSSLGGYVEGDSARLFMGAFRPALLAALAENIAATVIVASRNLQEASLRIGRVETVGLNWNRRHRAGPVDRRLTVVTVRRGKTNLRLISFGAHPVVASERERHTASACWPGELMKSLEDEGDEAMFIVGPVGGVNVLFPEGPMELDVHLALVARLLREQLALAVADDKPLRGEPTVAFAQAEVPLEIVVPRLLPARLAWLDTALTPLRLYARNFGRGTLPDRRATQVPVLRVGRLIYTGFPADLGAGVGLVARQLIEQHGYRTGAVASQTGDYVGYVHLPEDYERLPQGDHDALQLTVYENAMGFFGRDTGLKLLDGFKQALSAV